MLALAYWLFDQPAIQQLFNGAENSGYLGSLLAGGLYALGFTVPISIALLLSISVKNIFLASIIGGIGSVIIDYGIFKYVHLSFKKDFQKIEHLMIVKEAESVIEENFSSKVRNYFLFIFAGFILASPLPDEVGVSLLAGFTSIKPHILMILSFITHAIGIAIILYLGTII